MKSIAPMRRAGSGNHALAFIGDTLAENGDKVPELFIVDLPQDEAGWKQAGDAPLAGTATTMPAPPAWRQPASFDLHPPSPLSGTGERPAPLGARQSAGDGEIAFLMRDDAGVVQLWLISPQGGEPRS